MAHEGNHERQRAHDLIEMLPHEKVVAVRNLLEAMLDPANASLSSVPIEDEDLKPEASAALDKARASLARGEGVPHEDVLEEFGL